MRMDAQPLTPEQVRAMLATVHETRPASEPFDLVLAGGLDHLPAAEAAARLGALAEAGATWWQEGLLPSDSLDDLRALVRSGPPRL